jgi:predicted Zn-dependent protease
MLPPELPDRAVATAAENEVRAALASRWRFVTAATAQSYLDRIARQVAARIEGAPSGPHVALVQTDHHRTLALPSGTLILSTGLLLFLEDEAELVFVLGHEIAHAASGEAAVRLVRLGFQATARERFASDGLSWSDAAVDLARLGYGRKRERDADQCALSAMLALEYEPMSACRYLQRLHAAIAKGDEAVAETDVAHPTPLDRLRRLERSLSARPSAAAEVPRVNREVFRRALTPSTLAASPRPDGARHPRGDPLGRALPSRSQDPPLPLARRGRGGRRGRRGGRDRDLAAPLILLQLVSWRRVARRPGSSLS